MLRSRSLLAALLALAAIAPLPAAYAFASAQPGTTLLLGRPPGFGALPDDSVNDAHPSPEALSKDGRYLVFTSAADAMAVDDLDGVSNIYVRDLQTNTTTLVSRATGVAGAPANGDSFDAVISGDGTKVAFTSYATNLGALAGGQVYVRDLTAKTTTVISCANGAACTPGTGSAPSINNDGTKIAFESDGSTLTPDTTSATDIFVRNTTTHTTTLVSRETGVAGVQHNQSSTNPSISDSGTRVAWDTTATLDPTDANGKLDVYIRDVGANITRWVSHSAAIGLSQEPAISGDGLYVAFQTQVAFDAADDTNGLTDVYLWTYPSDTFILESRATGASTSAGNSSAYNAAITTNGSAVSFVTSATDLGDGDASSQSDVHVRAGITTSFVSRASGPSGAPADQASSAPSLDDTGAHVAFFSAASNLAPSAGPTDSGRVYVRDTGAQTTTLGSVPTGPSSIAFATAVGADSLATSSLFSGQSAGNPVSDDGRYVAFTSTTDALLGTDDDALSNVYVRDVLTGALTLASTSTSGQPADGHSGNASISADGTHVAFVSSATNLGAPGNVTYGVYVRDLAAGTTTLASRADGPSGAAAPSAFGTSLSADGTRVAFTASSSLDPKDTNSTTDAYVRDLANGTTTLVSRADGAGTNAGDNGAPLVSISGDGNRVAFISGSDDLGDGDTDTTENVHLRDLSANTTTLVDRADGVNGQKGDSIAWSLSLDRTGRHVAFDSSADNLASGAPINGTESYVRDVTAGTTQLVSRAGSSGAPADGDVAGSRISSDGRHVVFQVRASNLLPPSSTVVNGIFLRDLDAQTTTLVSVADGAAGAPAASAFSPGTDADGSCVAFVSASQLTTPGFASPDYTHVYLRAVSRQCPVMPPDTTIPPGPGTQITAPGDTAAPILSRLAITPNRFAIAARPTALVAARKRTRRGAQIVYTLSEQASTTLTVTRGAPGRRKGKRCVAPGKARKRARRCTRSVTIGTLTRKAASGKRRVPFSGRIGKRKLTPGRYVLTVRARDAAGNRSAPRTARFTILRG